MSIKDKITPGEWYANSHYVRTSNEVTYSIGHAYADKPAMVVEAEANARLWAKSKEMLNIIERLVNWNTADLVERNMLIAEAEILMNQLNKE